MNIDPSSLLKPVSDDAPCGPNLEYDPAFGELERAAQGTPERVMGDQVIPAEEPDWADVLEKAQSLFDKTKDLRIAVHLTHAGLKMSGLPAFAAGLELMHRMIDDFWDHLHPQLDAEDNNDATLRMNTLLSLNDRAGVIGSLARCALVQSKTLGQVTMRDIRVASGELARSPHGPEPLDPAHVDAAFLDGDLEQLRTNHEAVRRALDTLKAAGATLSDRIGAANAPDLGLLIAELRAMHGVLAQQLARRGAESGAPSDIAPPVSFQGAAAVGDVRSRDDVVRILDRLCEYFQKNEPSSPVPLLLRRARRLVAKDFMDILRDLTPDGVSQAKLIGGLDKDE